MAWWKTPVTLFLVQLRSQESCNKPMISIRPPTCYRTMTNFNSWEPCNKVLSIFLNDMVFYLFWIFLMSVLLFISSGSLFQRETPVFRDALWARAVVVADKCNMSVYLKSRSWISLRFHVLNIGVLGSFIHLYTKFRTLVFIDIIYLQHREFLKHFIHVVITTLNE